VVELEEVVRFEWSQCRHDDESETASATTLFITVKLRIKLPSGYFIFKEHRPIKNTETTKLIFFRHFTQNYLF